MTTTTTMTSTAKMPKRKAKAIDVPPLDEDPAERKRVLNVLAQRRYRRRKKEHLQKLERSAGLDSSSDSQSPSQPSTSTPDMDDSWVQLPVSTYTTGPTEDGLATDTGPMLLSPEFPPIDQEYMDPGCLNPSTFAAFDASYSFPLPSLPSSPSMSSCDTFSDRSRSLTPNKRSAKRQSVAFSNDQVHLPMLELNLLRGAMEVAKRLQVDSLIWSLNSKSPFYNSLFAPNSYMHLPINLQPTMVQQCNPHHPVLDILPWPSVRDKLILVFAQPEDLRPPNARTPMALLDFVYDMEDSAEGVRIWGDNPYSDSNWEIGEKLFKNWWWSLNSEVLQRSNELRQSRGATLLGPDREVEEIE